MALSTKTSLTTSGLPDFLAGSPNHRAATALSSVIKIESIITDPSHGLGLAGAIQRLNH